MYNPVLRLASLVLLSNVHFLLRKRRNRRKAPYWRSKNKSLSTRPPALPPKPQPRRPRNLPIPPRPNILLYLPRSNTSKPRKVPLRSHRRNRPRPVLPNPRTVDREQRPMGKARRKLDTRGTRRQTPNTIPLHPLAPKANLQTATRPGRRNEKSSKRPRRPSPRPRPGSPDRNLETPQKAHPIKTRT